MSLIITVGLSQAAFSLARWDHDYNTPFGGSYEWWGGSADDLNTTLTRTLDLTGATSASITAKAHVGHRGGLRLPLRRGVDQRRGHLVRPVQLAHRRR